MKKSLLALAAMGAFAGAAQAQSSVTVYGLLDLGYVGNSQTQAGATGVTKRQQSAIGTGGQATPRLGFRGNEDLGGGTSAFFVLEAAINQDTAGLFSTSASGNRQALVGLSKKGLGSASIGIQYTPIHEAVATTDAGNANNVMGDVIYDRSGTGATAYTASGMSTNDSYTVRSSNALILKSERMSGFALKGMLVSSGTDTTQTSTGTGGGGKANNSGWGIGADFVWQKLFVTANYQSFKNVTSSGATTFAPGYNGGNITQGVNAQDNQQYYAATYDFGILKAYVQYINRKVTNINDSDNYVSRTAQQIGVRVPVTAKVNAWASGGTGRINNTGTGAPTANFNGWQLGSEYFLSKRTNLYAIYGQSSTSNAQTAAYASGTLATGNTTSWNQSGYAIGVRHTF